ncbi:MAG: hypothetical protein ACO32I_08465 [Candidatus Limnocylindrus sp.]
MTGAALFWTAFTPFILLAWLVQRLPGVRGIGGLVFACLVAAGVVLFGCFGRCVAYWSASLSASLSVVLALLLIVAIAARAGFFAAFRAREWRAAWIFGAVCSLLLYPSAFGLGWQSFDSYSLGWPWLDWRLSSLVFASVAAVAGFLVWRGNRFGWVLVAASLVYLLRTQESQNYWDYLIDPLYAAISLLAVIKMSIDRLRSR